MTIGIRQVVLDTTDARGLAEFYRSLLGLVYRAGDEPPVAGPDLADWLCLRRADGSPVLAFQQVGVLPRVSWPAGVTPQQLHLDITVDSVAEHESSHSLALSLGATLLFDRSNDPHEPLRVYADPAGHPFCIFVI